jgi:hypothetical protein
MFNISKSLIGMIYILSCKFKHQHSTVIDLRNIGIDWKREASVMNKIIYQII